MGKIVAFFMLLAIALAIGLGVTWCIWSVWCWVLPQVYPTGPDNLLAPNFWLFCACWFLLGMVGRNVFGQNRSAQ